MCLHVANFGGSRTSKYCCKRSRSTSSISFSEPYFNVVSSNRTDLPKGSILTFSTTAVETIPIKLTGNHLYTRQIVLFPSTLGYDKTTMVYQDTNNIHRSSFKGVQWGSSQNNHNASVFAVNRLQYSQLGSQDESTVLEDSSNS